MAANPYDPNSHVLHNVVVMHSETSWVVRREEGPTYHIVANQWSQNPYTATVYRTEKDATRLIEDMRYHKRVGFAAEGKDSKEPVVEAVPLEGAITRYEIEKARAKKTLKKGGC